MTPEKQPENEDVPAEGNKEEASNELEEKEPEDKVSFNIFVSLFFVYDLDLFRFITKYLGSAGHLT